jgi:hypothetical protein
MAAQPANIKAVHGLHQAKTTPDDGDEAQSRCNYTKMEE